MRNLKLRYILELVSNIDRQAKSDAQVLAAAQQKIQAALQNTSGKFGLLERAMLRINGLSGAGIARQSQYLAKLANNALLARQRLERVGKGIAAVGRAGVNVAAAAGAAYYTTGRLIEKPMDYSNTLADMANTAFSSRDVAGRIAGKGELDGVIREALRKGGGSIEQATGSLNELLASGVLGDDELRALGAARTLLPSILQAAVAGGASRRAAAAPAGSGGRAAPAASASGRARPGRVDRCRPASGGPPARRPRAPPPRRRRGPHGR